MNNRDLKLGSEPVGHLDRREMLKRLIGTPPLISLALSLEAQAQTKSKTRILLDDLKITDQGILYGPVVNGDNSLTGYSDLSFEKKNFQNDNGSYYYALSSAKNLTVPATILADNTSEQALNIALKLVPQFNAVDFYSIQFSYLTPYNLPGTPEVKYRLVTSKGETTTEIVIPKVEIEVSFKSDKKETKIKKGRLTLTQVENAAGTTLNLAFKHLFDIDFDFSFNITLNILAGGARPNKPQSTN